MIDVFEKAVSLIPKNNLPNTIWLIDTNSLKISKLFNISIEEASKLLKTLNNQHPDKKSKD